MRAPKMAVAATSFALMLTLAACSNDQPTDDPAPPAATTTAAPDADQRAEPAVRAYEQFWLAANEALRAPVAAGAEYPPGADFAQYSFDPVRAEYRAYVGSLAAQQVEFRGTPPSPNATVTSVDEEAKPYPTVVLTDCQKQTDWEEYKSGTEEVVPEVSASVPPPYLITAELIYFEGHWGLRSTTTDTSRTCVP